MREFGASPPDERALTPKDGFFQVSISAKILSKPREGPVWGGPEPYAVPPHSIRGFTKTS